MRGAFLDHVPVVALVVENRRRLEEEDKDEEADDPESLDKQARSTILFPPAYERYKGT